MAQKGSIKLYGNTWYGFYRDGTGRQHKVSLRTSSQSIAQSKLDALIVEVNAGNATKAKVRRQVTKPETFEDAARRIIAQQESDGVKTADDRLSMLERYAFPMVGNVAASRITATQIRSVIDHASAGKMKRDDQGKLYQDKEDKPKANTLKNLLRYISTVTAQLWRDEVLKENPCSKVQLGRHERRTVRKVRAVLEDSELLAYLGWEHPAEHHRKAVRERQTMACLSRMLGGQRSGDLHSLQWEFFDTTGGHFRWCIIPREKTGTPQRFAIPALLRPILADWWQRAGRPTTGFVFPALRDGKHSKKGEGMKHGVSHAAGLRRDLARAFGLQVWSDGRWADADRERTPRERELLTETNTTLPVDFHSFRRGWSQALEGANVNAQQAMRLTGHTNLSTHQRYLANASRTLTVPEAALPDWSTGRYPDGNDDERSADDPSVFSAPPGRLELPTNGLGNRCSIH